ncbi:MAG: RNA 3'-terminal phosphate cyclase [Deltaproteobacteria bacterium]|nr:RNA 3'-terminal phosphate cyclase [Deltaproteobacteria bacterium]
MIEIDGSQGEGGGQILRTALALSVVSGKAFRIDRIRAGREKPGLMRQHLTCVQAAADVAAAVVVGASVGSTAVTFTPGPARHGDRTFSIGTAGATALVLQTVLPPLLVVAGRSRLIFEGGTHGKMAPPADFIERAFLPLLRKMGAKVSVVVEKRGFYPAGGGRVVVDVEGGHRLSALRLLERGRLVRAHARALVSNLPENVGHREVTVLRGRLPDLGLTRDDVEVVDVAGPGPGNALVLDLEFDELTEVISAIGERHKKAEAVAADVVAEAKAFLEAGVPVGAHLADQLLIPMALGSGGAFRTLALTPHTSTNIDVIRRFLDVDIGQRDSEGGVRIDVTVSHS